MNTTNNNDPKVAYHADTGLRAPLTEWRLIGATIKLGTVNEVSQLPHGMEELLVIGRELSRVDPNRPAIDRDLGAIAFALQERQRRSEAKTAATAQSKLGQAIAELAAAFHAQPVERLLGQLPEQLRAQVETVMAMDRNRG